MTPAEPLREMQPWGLCASLPCCFPSLSLTAWQKSSGEGNNGSRTASLCRCHDVILGLHILGLHGNVTRAMPVRAFFVPNVVIS